MRKVVILGMGVLALAGCADPGSLAAVGAAATLASLNTTQKTPVDLAVSATTDRDCSVVHLEKTGEYCPQPHAPPRPALVYCYRTLADVDCHRVPNPYNKSQRLLADPPPAEPVQGALPTVPAVPVSAASPLPDDPRSTVPVAPVTGNTAAPSTPPAAPTGTVGPAINLLTGTGQSAQPPPDETPTVKTAPSRITF